MIRAVPPASIWAMPTWIMFLEMSGMQLQSYLFVSKLNGDVEVEQELYYTHIRTTTCVLINLSQLSTYIHIYTHIIVHSLFSTQGAE